MNKKVYELIYLFTLTCVRLLHVMIRLKLARPFWPTKVRPTKVRPPFTLGVKAKKNKGPTLSIFGLLFGPKLLNKCYNIDVRTY